MFKFSVDECSSFHPNEKTMRKPTRDENECGVMDNPYYVLGSELELNSTTNSTQTVYLNDVQVVTATQNVYYKL